MEHERLSTLLARFEAGAASDAELDELEALLASDYEAREHFLDHAQMEGLLHGIGREGGIPFGKSGGGEGNVVPLETAGGRRLPEKRTSGRWIAPASVAAAAVLGAFGWIALRGAGGPETTGEPGGFELASTETSSEPLPRAPSASSRLSAEEQYQRSGMNRIGGASQAHPETAEKGAVASREEPVEFNRDIRPILSDNCFFCHGPDAAERKADLRLDTEEGALADLGGYAAVVRGDAGASELVARVLDHDPDSVMPPPESKRSLTEGEKQLLARWIEEGAEWQEHWSFEPPVKRPLPDVSHTRHAGWPENPVDSFILAKLYDEGMEPSPPADRASLLRRVTLDLTGLPPTIEEIDAFLADDSPDAYERVVDRLLRRGAHAERMAWYWMEAARYADTDGYQNDGPREMWRWRDWVIAAYRANMPFDRFTVEQLAGDLLPDPTRDQLIATGFNRNHRYNSESGLVLEEFLLENAVDRVDTTMTVWTGLTMGCARCHDHKYDPLTQKDYYRLVSYFDNITESGRAIKYGNSEPWIVAPTPGQEAELAEIGSRLAEAEKALAISEKGIAKRQAAWEKTDPDTGEPLVPRGLSRRYGVDEPIVADGEKPVDLEDKVDGLVCNNRFSIAFDLEPARVDRGVVLTNEEPGTRRQGIFVAFREGRLRFSINSRWIAGVAMLETERVFEPGERIHVVLTNDGTQRAKGMAIWIDGKQAAVRVIHNTNSNKGKVEGQRPLAVGASKHHPSWTGELSDLRVYSARTLDADEIDLLAEPATLPEILAKPGAERVPREAAVLRHYFLSHAAAGADRKRFEAVARIAAERQAFHDKLPTAMVMEESPEPKPTHLRIRGEYHNKGEVVESGVPEVFPQLAEGLPNNRLGFAKWLVGEDNPLTARVVVNQYWQLLFGTGLVKTAEDFGTQGSLPSHPDLLDWLAIEFRESGWDSRHLLKTLVTSATYRQSSAVREGDLKMDPENRYLARAPRLKLSGNVLRDQALASSGLLVDRIGGPSVKPYQPANLWRQASNFTYRQDQGVDLYRRSLYTYWKRTLAPPSMAVLDAADREWCSVKPKRTNTPLQALALLNETAFFEAARKLGERMVALPGATLEERVRHGFRSVLAREPGGEELALLAKAYRDHLAAYRKIPDEAEKILTVGESKTRPGTDPVELAAATAVANVLYNLEEASVRE